MNLTIDFPNCDGFRDTVEAKDLGEGRAMLTKHTCFLPLAPGDVVTLDGDRVTGVEWMAPVYTVLINFYLPADIPAFAAPTQEHRAVKAFNRVMEMWDADPALSVSTPAGFTALVSAASLEALHAVQRHQYVESWELRRTPELQLNWDFAVHRDDLFTMEGPWA